MKLSTWKENFDKKNKGSLRVISVNELLEITEFDNQPERSKREDILLEGPCKHFTSYAVQDGNGKIKSFFYDDLDQIMRKCADDAWLDNNMMRCSEHCGNTVRDK